jgi:hypothetical protein
MKDTFILLCNSLRESWISVFPKIITLVLTLLIFVGNFSCGRGKVNEAKPLKNSPPHIASVKILPENPKKESLFNLVIDSYDADYDRVVYQYHWLRNDEEMSGENKDTLKRVDLRKGDLIRVKVTPSDGKIEGEPFLSSPVKILNSPPLIEEIRIEPAIAYADNSLKAVVKSNDADEDNISYDYQWEKNGMILAGERTETLERGRFKRGDILAVTVIPDDGEKKGNPKKSEPITIANNPPVIISIPDTKTTGNIYTYQVNANDSDSDSVIFTLKSAPKGMEINKDTGLVRWEIRNEEKGTHTIEIEASDSEGGKSYQRYDLTVEFR